jgi:HD-GYP domain-containing protein (c-di-GMP phosphodiesterase class II)
MRPIDAGTERRLAAAFARHVGAMSPREALGEAAVALAFVAAAVLLALLGHDARTFDPLPALALTTGLALVAGVEFSVGASYTVPTQVVFVPMLLLLPTPFVPLLVAVGFLGRAGFEVARGRRAAGRMPLAVGDAWFSVAPALLLVLLGAQEPGWSHWPVYLAALAAQLLGDLLTAIARFWLCLGARPRETVAEWALVGWVEALLAPVGLLAAIAAASVPAAALLVLPLVGLLGILAREREERIAHSLELGRAYRGTALLLRDVLEEDDEYTGRHTEDVVGLSVQVAERLGVDEDVRRATELGALLHDIGKIVIPDAIINKPGPLDDDEWALMRTHTIEGQRMLDRVGGLLADVGVVVRASHERWDGRGYPDGLAGEAIPLAARIVSACDAFNAMTTDRSYRRALPLEVATKELADNAGTQFDPAVVEALIAVARRDEPAWRLELVEPAAEPVAPPVPDPAPRAA